MAKKKSSATKIILIVLALVFVLVGAGAGLKAAGVIGEKETGTVVETTDTETRNITQVVTASGRVQPEIEVSISPDVPGEIIALPVMEGDKVDKGALLARIRPDDYKAQVERGQASVLQAKAVLAQRRADMLNSELNLKRQQDLFNKNAISEAEFQRASTEYEVAKAGHEASDYAVQSSAAQLREFQEQLAKTTIYAPMSGTISMLLVELGERVVGTSQMAGTEMMRVAKLDQMEIEVDVNENDVVNVSIGDSSAIEIDAYPGRMFKGVVTEIANSARVSSAGTQEQVTNFPVKIRIYDVHNDAAGETMEEASLIASAEGPVIDEDAPNFRPGMSGTVDVFTRTVSDVVVVPIQAVTVRDFNKKKKSYLKKDNEEAEDEEAQPEDAENAESEEEVLQEDLRKVVFLFADGKAKMVEVETGISDDTHIEIKTGLTGSEKVIIGPYRAISRDLEADDEVRVDDKKNSSRFASAN
ncbi:MAG: efflux RND transporter periplasmic adaptor subunit [Rhodothermales bacterium]